MACRHDIRRKNELPAGLKTPSITPWESNVALKFMKSILPLGPKNIIRRVNRDIICHCGWIGLRPITFGKEEWSEVAVQQEETKRGIHLVLNSWANILKVNVNTLGRP